MAGSARRKVARAVHPRFVQLADILSGDLRERRKMAAPLVPPRQAIPGRAHRLGTAGPRM